MIGQTIAHYKVTEKLGAGGMGEVYRATDTKLNRDVALKVLPEEFSRDADRMARFKREAQVLASLNHPNIASIYGLEEADGIRCLVLELVEGPTLAERIGQGPLPLEEALNIARQIAEALEAAHEKGIIHRDLKPANVKVTPEGMVKVLDFGLAKALEDDPSSINISESPTLSVAATQAGVILGTAAYMSPEQARGQPVDKRADIWAFGVVLHEMLTGKQTFQGETISDTLAAVLKTDPDWNSLPAETPRGIRSLLRRCLQKSRERRLHDIADARLEIEEALSGEAVESSLPVPLGRPGGMLRLSLLLVGGIALGAALASVAFWGLRPAVSEAPFRKFDLGVEDLDTGNAYTPAISPDGRKIAYISGGRLWIRQLDQLEPRELSGTNGATAPFWSPDSAFVGYLAENKIWKVPIGGGESSIIAFTQGGFVGGRGASWGTDDRIIYSRGGTGLLEVPARGGEPRPLLDTDPKTDNDFHQPHSLPDGRGVLFVVHRTRHGVDTLALLAGGTRRVLLQLEGQSIWNPIYSPTGHILYRRAPANPGLWAVPFSLSRLEMTGEPFLVEPEGSFVSVSREGTLVYVRGASAVLRELVWVNRKGEVEGGVGQPQQNIRRPALSPDGRRAAVMGTENENADIWIHDLQRGTRTRLTFSAGVDWDPAWTPTGNQIVFWGGDDSSMAMKAADGTGQVVTLAESQGQPDGEPDISRDGKFLVYTALGEKTTLDLWYLPLAPEKGGAPGAGPANPVVFLQTPASERHPAFSPDGHYLAYVSDESGRDEVYVKQFPGGEGKWQVSVNGGHWPRWSTSSDRLFYVEDNFMLEVPVQTRPSLSLGNPRRLFSGQSTGTLVSGGFFGYAVSRDGQRFLMVRNAGEEGTKVSLTVVQNWFAEFKEKN